MGNLPILETIAAAGFSTLGMRGGSGGDCEGGAGCTEGDVCASWRCEELGDGAAGGGRGGVARAVSSTSTAFSSGPVGATRWRKVV